MAREPAGALHPEAGIIGAEIETADLKDATAEPFTFSTGRHVAVAEAGEMRSLANSLRADTDTALGLRRTTAKTAVIMGFPRPT